MPNAHQGKYVSKLLLGIALVTTGIFVILYATSNLTSEKDWYIWAIVASVIVNAGIFFVGGAFVHKIKSDLIRKSRKKDEQKSVAA